MLTRGAVTLVILLAGLMTLACSSGAGDDGPAATEGGEGPTRTATAGGIDVEVTWLGSDDEPREGLDAYPLDRFLLLEIGLDTHSGDLGSIDMVEAASLKADGDPLAPEEWIASSDDSHHRSGVLVFARELKMGPVMLTVDLGEGSVELVWDEEGD